MYWVTIHLLSWYEELVSKENISIVHLGFPSWHGILPAIAHLQISIFYILNCCFKLLLKRICDCHSFKLPIFVLWWIQILLFTLQMQSCRCSNPMTLAASQNMAFIFSLQVSTIVWWKLGRNGKGWIVLWLFCSWQVSH